MGKSCYAVGCADKFYKGCGLQFYRFLPDSERTTDRRRGWIAAIDRKNWEPNEFSWICSAHFVGGQKNDDPTSPAYVPTLFEHVESPVKRKAERDMVRYERVTEWKRRRLDAQKKEQAALALFDLSTNADLPEQGPTLGLSTMTEQTKDDITGLEVECYRLRRENADLKVEIARHQMSDDYFTDDSKVNYYTGLPSLKILMAIFDFVSPYVETSRSTLTEFQQFMLVLLKVRLNLDNQLIAFQFGIHASTVSRCFQKWIDVMYERLKPLVKWPDHEQLYKTMPVELKKKFGKCVVIIDCFEVFMERPKGVLARAQTWSNYKHHAQYS